MSDPNDRGELPPDIGALLDAERERPTPGDAEVARIRRSTESALAHAGASAGGGWLRRWGPRVLWALAGVTLGAAGMAWLHRDGTMHTRVVVRLVYVDATASADGTGAVDAALVRERDEDDGADGGAEVEHGGDGGGGEPTRRPGVRVGEPSLAVRSEQALVERARSALVRGDYAGALEAGREHARRWPMGALVEEREALMVRALVGAGRGVEARARAEGFVRRWPRSVLRPGVEAATRTIP